MDAPKSPEISGISIYAGEEKVSKMEIAVDEIKERKVACKKCNSKEA